ncbi:MAG: hypothetical protein HDS92_04475 [Bacteroidales bacterium]|nr:hypothetical protein [Bacteroidales bacterium]
MKKIFTTAAMLIACASLMVQPAIADNRHKGARPSHSASSQKGHEHSGSMRPGSSGHNRPDKGHHNGGGSSHNKPSQRPPQQQHKPDHKPNHQHKPDYKPNHQHKPDHKPNHQHEPQPQHRPGPAAHRPGHAHQPARPPHFAGHSRPSHFGHMPRPAVGWSRPVPPPHWKPRRAVPTIGTILGLTLGTAFDATLGYLASNNYVTSAYTPEEILVANVAAYGFSWPTARLLYSNGALYGSQYCYANPRNDRSRYNALYRSFTSTYGMPVSTTNISATWYGANNGFITLTYQPVSSGGALQYYTTVSLGN